MSEDTPHYGPMTEQRAREILAGHIGAGDSLQLAGTGWDSWKPGAREIGISGEFTADELEAIAWWMRNKGKYPSAGEG